MYMFAHVCAFNDAKVHFSVGFGRPSPAQQLVSLRRARFRPLSSEGHGGGLPSYRLSWPFGVGVCVCGCASPPLLSNRFAEEGPPSPPPPLWFSRVRAMGARHPGRFACVWVGVCSKETTNAPFFSPFFGKIETPGALSPSELPVTVYQQCSCGSCCVCDNPNQSRDSYAKHILKAGGRRGNAQSAANEDAAHSLWKRTCEPHLGP